MRAPGGLRCRVPFFLECCVPEAGEVLDLAWRVWGRSPPQVLLIHGLGDGACVWSPVIRLLGERFGGFVVDLRGHGDSPNAPMQRYGLRQLAADVEAIVRRQSPADLVIVGHSLGAEVGIELASALGPRARGLVLVDGGPEMDVQTARAIHDSLRLMPRHFDSAFELASLLAERHPLAEERLLVEYAHGSLRPAPNRDGFELKADPHFERGMRVYDSGALRQKLLLTTCRKLLIRGAVSAVWRQAATTALARELGCSVQTVPRAGHAIALENPAALAGLLLEFVAA